MHSVFLLPSDLRHEINRQALACRMKFGKIAEASHGLERLAEAALGHLLHWVICLQRPLPRNCISVLGNDSSAFSGLRLAPAAFRSLMMLWGGESSDREGQCARLLS